MYMALSTGNYDEGYIEWGVLCGNLHGEGEATKEREVEHTTCRLSLGGRGGTTLDDVLLWLYLVAMSAAMN
jgi:hypothetical protein